MGKIRNRSSSNKNTTYGVDKIPNGAYSTSRIICQSCNQAYHPHGINGCPNCNPSQADIASTTVSRKPVRGKLPPRKWEDVLAGKPPTEEEQKPI